MIARPHACEQSQLFALVQGQISPFDEESLALHLDSCLACQRKLDELSRREEDWEDSREMLASIADLRGKTRPADADSSDSIRANPDTESGAFKDKDAATAGTIQLAVGVDGGDEQSSQAEAAFQNDAHWVLKLLEPSKTTEALGTLDGLQVQSVVGQGGMGVVLRARDPKLNRELAIKLLSPMLSNNGTARQRFFREAQSAASVIHPNIVPIFSVSEDRELPYITMPYICGGNLQQLLDTDGPLPVQRTLAIGLQIAEGLAAAHAQGIVHRDIKPANMMIDGGGFRVMLTDFGLARALDDSTLTCSGMIAGTPQYMSPEQARGKTVDHRSDLYSLGAVLYALATGRPPVTGRATMDVLHRIGTAKPTPVVEINETYPLWFDQLILRLLDADASRRVQSAEQCCELLRECLAHLRSPRRAPLPVELRQKVSRTVLWSVGAGVVVAATLILAAVLGDVHLGGKQTSADGKSRDASSSSVVILPTEPAPDDDPSSRRDDGNPLSTLPRAASAPDADLPFQLSPIRSSVEWEAVDAESQLRNIQQSMDALRSDLGL